jgi:hypothetical protein
VSEGADKVFEGEGYSFMYPAAWEEQDPEASVEGEDVISSAFVGQDNTNVMGVYLYPLPGSITKDNIEGYADDISAQAKGIYENLGGQLSTGPTPVVVDGLPGFRYEGSLDNGDDVVQARITRVFAGTTEYYLYCQFTPEAAEEMKQGCDQVEESLRVESDTDRAIVAGALGGRDLPSAQIGRLRSIRGGTHLHCAPPRP